MKTFILIVISHIVISSYALAGGGLSRLVQTDIWSDAKSLPIKKFLPMENGKQKIPGVIKQTQGYKPERQPPPTWSYVALPKKIKFLDDTRERFIVLSGEKLGTEGRVPVMKQINGYTILVTYKKN